MSSERSTKPMSNEDEDGFRASLSGATLYDLIQIECTRRSQCCLEVVSGHRRGHLYFDHGQVIHAICDDAVGEEAVHRMLTWRTGSVDPVARPWPRHETIRASWQALLMTAAHTIDETARATPSAAPPPVAGRPVPVAPLPPDSGLHRAPPRPASPIPDPWQQREDIVDLVFTDQGGQRHDGRGETVALAETGAYVMHLAALIAVNLGMESVRGVDARMGDTRLLVRAHDGGVLAARGPIRDPLPPK